jgi:uncharacterized protein YndB with AHSA1/START domain
MLAVIIKPYGLMIKARKFAGTMTMPNQTSATVHVARHFEFSAERVFDAWLDPKKAGRWLFSTPTGQMVRVEIDARVGGGFVFIDRRNGEDIEHKGEYLELDRPKRLVFKFVVPKYSPLYSRVTIDIVPAGAGCSLTLVHESVLPEYKAQTQSGWTGILEGLAANLAPVPRA